MLRVVGTVVPPVQGQTLEHVTMLVQCIKSSVTTLENSFSPVECDKTGAYDFVLVEGVYRIYIKYSTNTPTIPLGTCGVVEGMPEELDLNNLLTNFTPQIPDYLQELDDKWEDTWQEFINDNNTQHSSINNSIALGDAKVIEDMSVYVNDVTGQQGAALREEIAVGDTGVYNESKAYTDAQGTQLASDITQVANDVSTVSQELVAYKDSAGNSFSEIDNRITTNEAELGSTISAQVEAETGAMQLRIEDVIATGNAEIAQSISIIDNGLGETQAAWQIVATVDDLTSAIGMTNDGVNSEIFMHANALKFVDPQDTSRSLDPIFEIQDGLVFMRSSFIRELGATTITSDEIRSPVFDNSQGFKLHSSGLAEFKNIVARGAIYATSGQFTGNVVVGNSPGYITEIRGSSSSTNQATFIVGHSSVGDYTNWKFKIDPDGSIHFRNKADITNGTETMTLDPVSGVATFNGEVRAEKIVGDVVSAYKYSTPPKTVSRSANGTSTTSVFLSVDIVNARDFDRTIMVMLEVETTLTISGSGDTAHAYGRIYYDGDFGTDTYSTTHLTREGLGNQVVESSVDRIPIYVDVPKNSSGNVNIYGQLQFSENAGSSAYSSLEIRSVGETNVTVAQLFSNGGDLG